MSERFLRLGDEAFDLYNRQQYSACYDKLMEATAAAPHALCLPRFNFFSRGLYLVNCGKVQPTKQQLQHLKTEFANKMSEHNIYRAEAMAVLGYLAQSKDHDFVKAAEWYHQGIELCKSSPKQDDKKVLDLIESSGKPLYVKDKVAIVKNQLQKRMALLEGHLPSAEVMAEAERIHEEHHENLTPVARPSPHGTLEQKTRSTAGGGYCDYCIKLAADVVNGELKRCSRCKLAFYCSKECQKNDWKKGGHKEACRAEGQVEIGDEMVVTGTAIAVKEGTGTVETRDPDGCIGRVINKADERDMWQVQVDSGAHPGLYLVANKDLRRLRPKNLKCPAKFVPDMLEEIS